MTHSWSNFRFQANKDNQPNGQMVRYTLHQYKDDNKPKNEIINLFFLLKDLLALSGPQHGRISFGQTQLLLLIWLYCMLLLPCHVLPIYGSCIKIHSTDESHEVWSILGGGCLGCGTLHYDSWKPQSVQKVITIYRLYHGLHWELDSIVSIATHYRLHGPGIESAGGEIFYTCPDQPWVPPRLLNNAYWVSFLGVVQSGHGNDHPPPSSTEVKETVKLYLYSPCGPSWPVLRRTLLSYFGTLNLALRNDKSFPCIPFQDKSFWRFKLQYVIKQGNTMTSGEP